MTQTFTFGYGQEPVKLHLDKLNRHGIIAGATGTGKTISLKVIAEQLSKAGIPVFLSDIKGDLMSLAEENPGENLQERLEATQYADYVPESFPIEIWDVLGEEGVPLRMTISEMGPILLARLLGLNDTQTGILNIAFNVADKEGLLLIDLMDLRAMLNFVGEHAKTLSTHYGNISKSSIGVILRSLIVLENQGGNIFFGEPDIDLSDFIRQDASGRGVINILNSKELFNQPTLYSTVLLAILSELFETLPEVGDTDVPKLVFFFDEAHLLFKDTPKALVEKIELVVRLIRSKGVGVFFVTQNPTDIPDEVGSQLGNRVQHGLLAFTPKEIRTVNAVADTFRQEDEVDLSEVIQSLEVGEAVVSTLESDGTPSYAQRAMIYPPMSKIGILDPNLSSRLINQSLLLEKYAEPVNRESAHEVIEALVKQTEEEMIDQAKDIPQEEIKAETTEKSGGSLLDVLAESISTSTQRSKSRRTDSNFDRFTKNLMSQVGREVGRVVSRGITGMFK